MDCNKGWLDLTSRAYGLLNQRSGIGKHNFPGVTSENGMELVDMERISKLVCLGDMSGWFTHLEDKYIKSLKFGPDTTIVKQ